MKQYKKSFVVKLSVFLVSGTALLTALFVSLMFLTGGLFSGSGRMMKLHRIQSLIDTFYYGEYDEELLDEGAYYGVPLMLGDPYSCYLSADDVQALQEEVSGEYVGIGVEITMHPEDNMVTVISPIADSPADRAGIRTGDKLLTVDGKEISGYSLDDVVSLLKNGQKGEEIQITLLRNGETVSVTVVRDEIVVHSVSGEMLTDAVGYIKISSFDDTTLEDFPDVLEKLEESGASSVVLDLRGNPGGTVEAAKCVAEILLDKGTFYYTMDKSGKKEYCNTESGMDDIPMAVLINGGSASASEMLAGALQDRDRATLVGETTYGKGIMQQHFVVDADSMLKLTTHEFFTPNGNRIHQTGISPDVEVTMDEEAEQGNLEQDTQLQKAVSLLTEKN